MTEMDEKNIEELEQDTEIEGEDASETSDENLVDDESSKLKSELLEKSKLCDEYLDLAKRTKAEFDNYRKRSVKEKESMYDDGFIDGIKQILPVIDNLERAVATSTSENDNLVSGVEMVLKMFSDTLAKASVDEISAAGEKFDPNLHNAVMHIEDENYEENVVVEVLQKGYKYKDKVIRYSMVKVAN